MDVVGFAPGWSRIPGPATGNLTSSDGESWRRLGFFGQGAFTGMGFPTAP